MGLKPPYQPRYGAMPTIGDLQMVKGFNEAIFNRVSPFLTVMPVIAVNANTAAPQVLAALEPELMEDQKIVEQIIEARAIRPFTQTTDIMNLSDLGEVAQRLSKDVGVRSQFFHDYRNWNLCRRSQNHHRNLPSREQRHRHTCGVA